MTSRESESSWARLSLLIWEAAMAWGLIPVW